LLEVRQLRGHPALIAHHHRVALLVGAAHAPAREHVLDVETAQPLARLRQRAPQ
jgi:hypothetical protein